MIIRGSSLLDIASSHRRPNICTIYDVGESQAPDDASYLVMERLHRVDPPATGPYRSREQAVDRLRLRSWNPMAPILLPIHIVGGGLAIILGAVALLARKGAALHTRSGLLFVYAMLTMGISGSVLAVMQSWTNPNVLGGVMSAYFVITALTAVRPVSAWTRRFDLLALAMAIGLVLFELTLGIRALNGHAVRGVPTFMLFFLAAITSLAASGDVRVMWKGALRGGPRLARHLWRMCFALFIAAGSFFSIRARVARILPAPFTTGTMRALPVLLIFAAMFYWLWRVRGRRGFVPARA
jgi:uncharacterized membrane protein